MDRIGAGIKPMKSMSAKDAKNAFGMLIDNARAEPVAIEKHGRKVVVVIAVEEYERLKAQDIFPIHQARLVTILFQSKS
jgi:prevent-host-death family protein